MATNNPISSGFRLYLRFSSGAALTPALANSYGWHVNWAAINGTVQAIKKYYDAGGLGTPDQPATVVGSMPTSYRYSGQ